jgi:hypothetical protein
MADRARVSKLEDMKRSPELIHFSHDHHHALDIARRLRRVEPDGLEQVRAAYEAFWADRGAEHFAEEERELTADRLDSAEWRAGVARMLAEHEDIRGRRVDSVEAARALGDLLHDHVRFEERELFALLEAQR